MILKYEKTEQIEDIQERVKIITEALAQWENFVNVAIVKAKSSLKELSQLLLNIKKFGQ